MTQDVEADSPSNKASSRMLLRVLHSLNVSCTLTKSTRLRGIHNAKHLGPKRLVNHVPSLRIHPRHSSLRSLGRFTSDCSTSIGKPKNCRVPIERNGTIPAEEARLGWLYQHQDHPRSRQTKSL